MVWLSIAGIVLMKEGFWGVDACPKIGSSKSSTYVQKYADSGCVLIGCAKSKILLTFDYDFIDPTLRALFGKRETQGTS